MKPVFSAAAPSGRLESLDAYRGVIMLLMALDHASALVGNHTHGSGFESFAGPFNTHPGLAHFLTRAVTHLCAPGFAVLMGAAMHFFAVSRRKAGWTRKQIVRHFIFRGAVLLCLQFFLENVAWRLGGVMGEGVHYFGVISMLGAAMITAGFMVGRSAKWAALLGVGLLLLDWSLLPYMRSIPTDAVPLPYLLLFVPGSGDGLISLYPVLPWLGVVLLGMAGGEYISRNGPRALKQGGMLGILMLAAYIPARIFGGEWLNARNLLLDGSLTAFLQVVKYPPSFVYLFGTLGVGLCIIAALQKSIDAQAVWHRPLLNVLIIVGRTPLFFYFTHLALYNVVRVLFFPDLTGLPGVYLAWLMGLLVLIPLCKWYGALKYSKNPTSILRKL